MAPRTWLGAAPAALLALAVATGTACEVRAGDGDFSIDLFQGHAADTWSRTYTVAPGGRVEIINVNGQITAEAATGDRVEVQAERSASAGSDDAARELLGKIEMREEASPERVRIETVAPKIRFGGHKVAYTVRVPAGVHVDLRTVNGGVRLDNVGGEVRATSTNGGIKGRVAASSVIEARTTNGGVELDLTGAFGAGGRMTVSSVNGGVRIRVPEDTKADLSARCTNGHISVSDLSFDAEGGQSRRRVEGRLNGGGGRIELSTVNGGVTIGRS